MVCCKEPRACFIAALAVWLGGTGRESRTTTEGVLPAGLSAIVFCIFAVNCGYEGRSYAGTVF